LNILFHRAHKIWGMGTAFLPESFNELTNSDILLIPYHGLVNICPKQIMVPLSLLNEVVSVIPNNFLHWWKANSYFFLYIIYEYHRFLLGWPIDEIRFMSRLLMIMIFLPKLPSYQYYCPSWDWKYVQAPKNMFLLIYLQESKYSNIGFKICQTHCLLNLD